MYRKKKRLLLILPVIVCVLAALAAVAAAVLEHRCVCWISSQEDTIETVSDTSARALSLDGEIRDRLISRVIREELTTFRQPVSFAIQSEYTVLCNGRIARQCLVRAVDADGFSALFFVILQPRWQIADNF